MNKEIQKLLNSKSSKQINKGIELFGEKGSIKELPLLLSLLNRTDAIDYEKSIVETVSNVKVKEANTVIVDAIFNAKKESVNLTSYMQICWQSTLNFSEHLTLFLEIFIENDYLTALEAFTVIENVWNDYSYDNEFRQLLLTKLDANIDKMDKDKQILAKELVLVIKG